MAEEILDVLAKIPALTVISRTSSCRNSGALEYFKPGNIHGD